MERREKKRGKNEGAVALARFDRVTNTILCQGRSAYRRLTASDGTGSIIGSIRNASD